MAEAASNGFEGVRAVTSNQDDIYKYLDEVVGKYAATRFLRPFADHTRAAFAEAEKFVADFYGAKCGKALHIEGFEVVLDSGCGTGESTLHLARRFPDVPVIGIDRSAVRLNKAGNTRQLENLGAAACPSEAIAVTGSAEVPTNAFWVRGELLDFWRLALENVQAGRWRIVHHAVYYPNPWPKEGEATRRFHLHPIFPTMMQLSPITELRTNWDIYAREFAAASRILEPAAKITCNPFEPANPETAFERKYKEARQQLWRVLVNKP